MAGLRRLQVVQLARRAALQLAADAGGPSTTSAAFSQLPKSYLSRRFAAEAQPAEGWVGQAKAALQRHQPALQAWEQKTLALWRQKAAAVTCGFTDTPSGQALLASVVPTAVLMHLFPARFRALARDASHVNIRLDTLGSQHQQKEQTVLDSLAAKLPSIQLPQSVVALLDELLIWARGLYLAALFTPVVLMAPAAFFLGVGRQQWMDLMRWTLERAGPAFIKWGQWSSTRPDLFPQDLCTSLEKLQTCAPSHAGALSRQIVDGAFRQLCGGDRCVYPPHAVIFDKFEERPVASGSIAQVHRARLTATGADMVNARMGTRLRAGTWVAVKVRHPGVSTLMHRDFVLMERAARAASSLPGLKDLRLDESIRQFGGPLKEQLDLSVEAQHLERFKRNFRLWTNVSFPTPMHPLVSSEVLVESFEEGDLISTFVNEPEYQHRNVLAQTGLNLYLQMLLKDNFIHADLHPGNILVREVDVHSLRGITRLLSNLLQLRFQPNVILLDTGMIAELAQQDQSNLVSFFTALTKQDGENVARYILQLSEQTTCKDPTAFVTSMRTMFDALDPSTISEHTAEVMKDMIEVLRQHQVTLKSTVSTVLVTSMVLEGWSNKLNPDLHILDTMRDMLAMDWSDRISRTVDKIMSSGSVAVV